MLKSENAPLNLLLFSGEYDTVAWTWGSEGGKEGSGRGVGRRGQNEEISGLSSSITVQPPSHQLQQRCCVVYSGDLRWAAHALAAPPHPNKMGPCQ